MLGTGRVNKVFFSWDFHKCLKNGSKYETCFYKCVYSHQEDYSCLQTTLLKRDSNRHVTLVKKRLQRRCFPVNFVKFVRTRF